MDARPIRPLDSSSHVAQRSRRDKLRVLGSVDDCPTNPGLMLPPDYHHSQPIIYRDGNGNGNDMAWPPNQLLVSQDCTSSKLYADPHSVDGLTRLYSHHHSPNWVATGSSNSSRSSNQNLVYVRQVLSAPDSKVATNSMLAHPPSGNSVQDTRQKDDGYADGFPPRCYPDTLREFVSPAAVALQMNAGNELALLPAYGRDQLNALGCDNIVAWNNHSAEVASMANRGISDHNAQGLSLTLSSNPSSSLLMIRDARDSSDNYAYNSNYSNSITKPSMMDRKPANALHEIMGVSASGSQWSTGPLGPFTGYATILKSSKFLKPTQDLLDDLCRVTSSKPVEMHVMLERIYQESFMGSNNGEASSSSSNFPPEDNQKSETLLLMLDEVCRRYRQYHQQMQMVVSSFESVAGLSAATPYISLALKTVSRNFRCLKNAISEHLRSMKKSAGDTLLSPNTGPSTSKGDLDSPKVLNSSQGFTSKGRYLGDNMGFLDAHHVWRPQRGLPERSVAILRAWLFEHFLHPYPTDTDKHMLATQAGLSRNQVSNWFINARVRLWKPLVEEIHALETKRLAEANPSSAQIHETAAVEVSSRREAMRHQPSSSNRVDDHYMLPAGSEERSLYGSNAEQLSQELCSRLEGQLPVSSEGPFAFTRHPHGGIEYSGFAPVSLSLGLRHGAQRRDDGLKQHYGGELFRNFVGGT